MFSMEAFCYHHKGLSKFGALKKSLCFQGGGYKGSRHWQQRLLTRLSFVNRHHHVYNFLKQDKKNVLTTYWETRFHDKQKQTHLFFCQLCIPCWTAGQSHWSPLWPAFPTVVLFYNCPSCLFYKKLWETSANV